MNDRLDIGQRLYPRQSGYAGTVRSGAGSTPGLTGSGSWYDEGRSGEPVGNPGPAQSAYPLQRDDRIRADICASLAERSDIDAADLTLDVALGIVTLMGTVPTRRMIYLVEDLCDETPGVIDVDNKLTVRSAAARPTGFRSASGYLSEATGEGSRGGVLARLFGLAGGSAVRDVMTREVKTVTRDDGLHVAARIMREEDVGAIPVCDSGKLVGMVTDRDIVVRAIALGMDCDLCAVDEVMTPDPRSCREDDRICAVLEKMADLKIRRIPVIDPENRLVGIVSLGDFAVREHRSIDKTFERISQPN